MKDYKEPHSNGVGGKAVVYIITALVVIQVAAALSISVNAPESIKEGELLSVNFTANETGANYSIEKNGQVVSSTTYYDWQTGLNNSGTYTFRFNASKGNETVSELRVIEVLDSPGKLKINNPPNDVISNEELRISVNTPDETESCTYDIEGDSGNLNEGEDDWFKVTLVDEGVKNLTVSCTTPNENLQASRIFIVDTTPPSITSKNPEGSFSGTPVRLELKTNENSVCRYSKEDLEFSLMTKEFSQTGGSEHKQIVNINEQGDVTYFVSCRDRHGNTMTRTEAVSFFANLRPTAEITLEEGDSKEELLKPGTYEVKIKTSEPVIEPSLEFSYSKENKKREISLQGSGTNWEGFIAIDEEIESDVGTFYFNSQDMTELQGTEITKGKIFLVDTEKPEKVEDFTLKRNGLDVKIEWIYDGEPVDYFEIYRSKNPNVDRLDKWDETPEDFYIDQNVLTDTQYYYRIAPVDKAGNIGPMTDAKDITIKFNETKQTNPEVVEKFNETQKYLQKKIFDIETSIKNMENENDRAKQQVIERLGLLEQARDAKRSLQTLMNEIEKLKLVGLTEEEADKRIKVFMNNADTKKVAEEIEIVDNTRYDQTLLERDIESAVNEVLIGINMNEKQRQEYIQSTKKLQDTITVNLEATSTRVNYMNTPESREVTLIHKNILSQNQIPDAIIVENIDKGVARRVSELSFEKEPSVLQPDPVVKWESRDLTNYNIYYSVEKLADISEVKKSFTVVMERPTVEDNEITGAAITEPKSTETGDFGSILLLFFGSVIAGGLLIYYVVYVKDSGESHRIMPQVQQQVKRRRHPQKVVQIHGKLRKAHSSIDAVKYEEALQLYKEVLEHLDDTDLDDKYRGKLEEKTRNLYDKIQLLTNLRKAHSAVDTRDVKELKDKMLSIRDSYHQLEDRTELAEHVRKSYSYFINHLKGLDREEFFRNLEL